MASVEGTKLFTGLYQGSAPRSVADLRAARVDLLVLCARELQPERETLRGIRYLRCPLDDNGSLSERHWQRAYSTATQVARAVRRGQRVLVTCMQGRNRSGLVDGIALHLLTGSSGCAAADYIRRRRPTALTNEAFARALCQRLPRARPPDQRPWA